MRGRLKPAQSECKRCEKLFCYFQTNSPRAYCSVCVEAEQRETGVFWRDLRRARRIVEKWEDQRRVA